MTNAHILAARFLSPRMTQRPLVLDRIHVREFILDAHIGAFSEEHGVTQRVAFNVELSLYPAPRPPGENLDNVLSYDVIVDGIRAIVGEGHIVLAETLAERVAAHCLGDRRVAKAAVTVEKLDRIPGARLGVSIERYQGGAFAGNVTKLAR